MYHHQKYIFKYLRGNEVTVECIGCDIIASFILAGRKYSTTFHSYSPEEIYLNIKENNKNFELDSIPIKKLPVKLYELYLKEKLEEFKKKSPELNLKGVMEFNDNLSWKKYPEGHMEDMLRREKTYRLLRKKK